MATYQINGEIIEGYADNGAAFCNITCLFEKPEGTPQETTQDILISNGINPLTNQGVLTDLPVGNAVPLASRERFLQAFADLQEELFDPNPVGYRK